MASADYIRIEDELMKISESDYTSPNIDIWE